MRSLLAFKDYTESPRIRSILYSKFTSGAALAEFVRPVLRESIQNRKNNPGWCLHDWLRQRPVTRWNPPRIVVGVVFDPEVEGLAPGRECALACSAESQYQIRTGYGH